MTMAHTSLAPAQPFSGSRVAQISDHVRRLVDRGILEPGRRLPTERELAIQFGVSVPTVNKAMAALEAGGYLVRQVGTGTSVAPDVGRGSIALSFHSSLVERGPLFYRALIHRLSLRITAAGFNADLALAPATSEGGVDRDPLARSLARGRVVGIIALGWSETLASAAASRSLPMTTIAVRPEGRGGFHLDYPGLLDQAVGHLAERGHRRIALMTHEDETGLASHCAAFQGAMAARGLGAGAVLIAGLAGEVAAGLAMHRLIVGPDGPRAVVVADENLLPGIATATAIHGLRMPQDLAVVSHATLGLELGSAAGYTLCGFALDDIADRLASRILAAVHSGEGIADDGIAIAARLVQGRST
jgi:DNA-binding LacI/PurR family transcriptional regulator